MTSRGMSLIYNGGLQAGGRKIVPGSQKAKKHKVVSTVGNVSDALGTTSFLNTKSKGLFSKAVKNGKKKGYGNYSFTLRLLLHSGITPSFRQLLLHHYSENYSFTEGVIVRVKE
eukprot:Lithocolla_globosa_v1_NODE_8419_length_823_cov_8.993490.p1 type:complete len:114 gc:universal NODE_8419_length_823_cov_8.993490:166-507(+)